MESTEKELSHAERIHLIESMISLAKNKINEDGFHFLLWGILVILASIANYLMITIWPSRYSALPWMIMPVIGVPAAIIYEMRKKKTEKIKSHMDHYYGYLWMAMGLTLFCVIYFAAKNEISPIPFILSLVGLATFISGNILNTNSLKFGGIVFWISAFIAVYSKPELQLLINAGATFIGYIIPGLILWRNYKAD